MILSKTWQQLSLKRQSSKCPKVILCACGCKKTRLDRDKKGYPRQFIHGHSRGIHGPNWKGRRVIRNGCLSILKPNHPCAGVSGYVYASILAYEEYHKCCILPWTIMHHKNRDKLNHDPSNLQPFTYAVR